MFCISKDTMSDPVVSIHTNRLKGVRNYLPENIFNVKFPALPASCSGVWRSAQELGDLASMSPLGCLAFGVRGLATGVRSLAFGERHMAFGGAGGLIIGVRITAGSVAQVG